MTTISTVFNFTGGMQTYTVPAGVASVTVVAQGCSGSSWGGSGGGTGATVTGTLAVSGGQVLNIFIGGGGGQSSAGVGGGGGYNGGGVGGSTGGQAGFFGGGGGGGACDVRSGGTALANRILIAGGGGGATNSVNGGGGGALASVAPNGGGTNGGLGGSQVAGGASGGAAGGSAGTSGQGGVGGGNTVKDGGGGGGGGLWGGGGGGYTTGGLNPGAGGGGSSFQTGFTSTSSSAGTTGGNPFVSPYNDGSVTISFVDNAPTAPTLTAPTNFGYADSNNAILDWTFNDPDSADFQTKADIRYRVAYLFGSWTTLLGAVGGTTSVYTATGLDVGVLYEWQVRTYDSQGLVSPYSSSSFFTATPSPAPPAGFSSPTPGQPISGVGAVAINWVRPLRNQSGWNIRRVADLNGSPDYTNIIETDSGSSSTASSTNFIQTSAHPDGPEHWQIQFATYNGTVLSAWYDIFVVMSVNAPGQAPVCTAVGSAGSGSIAVTEQFSDLSVDYFSKTTVPTTADTGQALTSSGTPALVGSGANAMLFNNTTVFAQSANVGAKILSAQATFQLAAISTTHANSISLVAGDSGFANCYMLCTSTRSGWSISKVVAGTQTVLLSGSYASLLPGPFVPLTIMAWVSGTSINFYDALGVLHTTSDAVIGSQTGTFFKVSVDNTGTTTPDKFQVAHWSASDTAIVAWTATLSRSTDGVNFAPIPGAEWSTMTYGALFTYTDYAAPFNTRVYYQVNAYSFLGDLVQSAIS